MNFGGGIIYFETVINVVTIFTYVDCKFYTKIYTCKLIPNIIRKFK